MAGIVGSRAELATLVGAVRQGLANSTQLLSLAAGTDDGAADDALTQAMSDVDPSATLVGASAQPTEVAILLLREQSTVSLALTAAMRGVLSGDASAPAMPPRTPRTPRSQASSPYPELRGLGAPPTAPPPAAWLPRPPPPRSSSRRATRRGRRRRRPS